MDPAPGTHGTSRDDWRRVEQTFGGGRAAAPRGGVAATALLSLVAVAVVSAASADLLPRLRDDVPGISVGTVLADVVAVLLAAMLLGFALLLYAATAERARSAQGPEPPRRDEQEPERHLSWTALLLPLLLLSVVSLVLAVGWLWGRPGADTVTRLPPAAPHTPAPAPAVGASGNSVPVHWVVFAAVSAVGGSVAAVLLLRERLRGRRRGRVPPLDELLGAVDESLGELEREPDARLAVVQAYARMERALAAQGTERRPPETPQEYLPRALAAVQVSRASVVRLTSLFQQAKFSRHAVDADTKAEAIRALRDLRAELADRAAR